MMSKLSLVFLPLILLSVPSPAWWAASDDLLDAARKGDLAAVNTALEAKADIEAKTRYGQTPLFLAAMNGHTAVVKSLLDKGAQVDVTDTFYKFSMVNFVASRKHIEVLKLLLPRSKSPDENLDGMTRMGNAELVSMVIEGPSKPSQAALDRNMEAAASNAQIAGILSKAGAKPPPPAVAIDAKTLEEYSGTYKADGFPLDIKAFAKDGKLYMQATGQPEFAPKAKSATLFEFAPANLQIEFTGPGAFVLRQMGQTINFKKAVTQ